MHVIITLSFVELQNNLGIDIFSMCIGRIRSSPVPIHDGDGRETKEPAALTSSTVCQTPSSLLDTVLNKSFNPVMYLVILQFTEEES